MKTVLYYFSGTGNSLAAAKALARELAGTVELLPIAGRAKAPRVEIDGERLGLIFPVYFRSIPEAVRSFLKKLEFRADPYIFAVVTCNAVPGHSLYTVKRLLQKKGRALAAGFAVDMPGNAMLNPTEVQQERLAAAPAKLAAIVKAIAAGRGGIIEGSHDPQDYLRGLAMAALVKYVIRLQKRLAIGDGCDRCGRCARICPMRNITLAAEGGPVRGNRCQLCLACFHWCPRRAVTMGKPSAGLRQYHHPEISVEEMMGPR
jgi:ferredoxin/flavodoxin